jgi:hypothetical protein
MTTRGARLIGIAVVAGMLGTVRLAAAQTLIVHVLDHTRVPRSELAEAQKETTQIYERSGVQTLWVDGELTSAIDDRGLHLAILLVAGPDSAAVPDHALGCAPHPTRAYIYHDRVEAFARRYALNVGVLLGKVMAHEIGHLLLPGQGHSDEGIMRAEPNVKVHSIRFTPAQGNAIRIRVAATRAME